MASINELQMSEEQKKQYNELVNNNELLDKKIDEATGEIKEKLKLMLENKDDFNGNDIWLLLILLILFWGDKK